MSVVTDSPPSAAAEGAPSCAHCGASMEADQEWCLECGSARTTIHPAPDWRIPLAIVGGVVLLAAAAFAIALTNLSTQANRITQTQPRAAAAPVKSTPAASTNTAASPTTTTAAAKIPGWATGLSGWTVILAQRRFEAKADNVAREFQGAGLSAGVLNSSQHPSMIPGFFLVFSGRYPTQAAAQAAAAKLQAAGHKRAHAREVAPPGGI